MGSFGISCIACGSGMQEKYAAMFDDRYGCPGYFSLHECPNCRQLQTVPLLSDSELPALYRSFYPRRNIEPAAVAAAVADPRTWRSRVKRWFSGTDNQGHYVAKPGMVVLDYGCGAGQSLLELQKIGARPYGIEADSNVLPIAQDLKLNIHIGTLEDDPFPGLSFDLVVLNQVLEHVPSPEVLLSRIATRLGPSGEVVFCVPNARSVYARTFGRKWINWHIPYHLHHFNARSLRLFFARHGWRITTMRTITPNLWTVLQLRALEEVPRMGVASSLWTGETKDRVSSESRISLRLARALAQRPISRQLIGVTNRMLDAARVGDSILFSAVPSRLEVV